LSLRASLQNPHRIAVVPARAGSKGLPGKNLAPIGGQSLVTRAVRCALETRLFAEVVLSTDDTAIADAGKAAGASVPFLRPSALASDTSPVTDAIHHLLTEYENRYGRIFDVLALLEPTSPNRTVEIVRATVFAAEEEGADAALTVSEVPLKHHPFKQLREDATGYAVQAHPEGRVEQNRQALGPTYIRNGMCYAVRVPALGQFGLFGSRAKLLPVEGFYTNIDSESDLQLARESLEAGYPSACLRSHDRP
jgi:CMP-N-acetylneuraminic acid synthetase